MVRLEYNQVKQKDPSLNLTLHVLEYSLMQQHEIEGTPCSPEASGNNTCSIHPLHGMI